MAVDTQLENAIAINQANVIAATTKDEAGAIVANDLDTLQRNADTMGWTGPDLAYAYNQMMQAYNAWEAPLIAENDGGQVIVSQASQVPAGPIVSVTIEPPGTLSEMQPTYFVATQRGVTAGRVVVAAGFAVAGLGLVLLAWRALWGGAQYRTY